MAKIKDYLLNYVKSRRLGFYLLLATAVLGLFVTIFYTAKFNGTARYDAGAAFFPLLGFAALLLTLYKPIERYTAIVMNIISIFALLIFLSASYMHFGDTFFAVQDNMPTNIFVILNMLGFNYSYSLLALAANILITFSCIFIPISSNKEKDSKEGGSK